MILGVIPARYNSSRFPGKPLAQILGKPMIQRVWEGASQSKLITNLVVASDSKEIVSCVQSFGGRALMTDQRHSSGTSRAIEVALRYELEESDIVVIIQGDEPLITGEVLDGMLFLFLSNQCQFRGSSIYTDLLPEQRNDPNIVKVLVSRNGRSIYFSRTMIPGSYRHIGIYAYRWPALDLFFEIPESSLERIENLEQLRMVENDCQYQMFYTESHLISVDIPSDIQKVAKLMSDQI